MRAETDKCVLMRRFSFTSLLIYLISILPFAVLYVLSDLMYVILYRIIGYRKAVVRENLLKSFPEKTPQDRQEIERKFYRFLPDLIVETIKMRTISEKELRKRFILKNPELVTDLFRQGKPVVGVTAHYANWEMGIFALNLMSEFPTLIIYKPLANERFGAIFNQIRSRFGAIMVPMKKTLRYVVRYKDEPHMSVFVSDQTPRYTESDYFIRFLNQDTLVFTGAARIAKRIEAPVVYCHIDRVKRGYYETTFTMITDRPNDYTEHSLTDLYNRFTENIIKNKPELWLWSHRRWKRQPLAQHQVNPQSL